jgi:hypothetical protein
VGARQHDVRIEVQVAGGRAVGAANTTAAATPAATHAAPPAAYQAPSQPAQQHAAPAAAPVGTSFAVDTFLTVLASGAAVISYTLPGRAGGADKVKVAAAQQAVRKCLETQLTSSGFVPLHPRGCWSRHSD